MSRTRGVSLLDVNVLVALAWPNHVHHDAARRWFIEHHRDGWATTPVTELGFVRVSSNRSAVGSATTPASAIRLLGLMTEQAGHEFWPDAVAAVVGDDQSDRITSYRDVTDAHLVALARQRDGRLVTFDAGIARLFEPSDDLLDLQRADES